MTLSDVINGYPLKLDVELGYNQFGETIHFLNSGDTAITDGRYGHKELSGEVHHLPAYI